jgi:hypothetical protein
MVFEESRIEPGRGVQRDRSLTGSSYFRALGGHLDPAHGVGRTGLPSRAPLFAEAGVNPASSPLEMITTRVSHGDRIGPEHHSYLAA